ncbi:hypothetical protein [Streptomyces sp. NPDC001388]|uniref:hypothetical protein n=1 Tax=Streptomyces sp. NPDC001388 TaxID=3364568 RepID=UPI003689E343
MRTKLAMLAAGSAAALALGGFAAAPASADEVGVQAIVGTAFTAPNGNGLPTPLVDDVLNTCIPIGQVAQSGIKLTSTRTITVYDDLTCSSGAVNVNTTTTNFGGIKLAYIVT